MKYAFIFSSLILGGCLEVPEFDTAASNNDMSAAVTIPDLLVFDVATVTTTSEIESIVSSDESVVSVTTDFELNCLKPGVASLDIRLNGTVVTKEVTVNEPDIISAKSINSGVCVLTQNGAMFCRGDDRFRGTTEDADGFWSRVAIDGRVTQFDAGRDAICAVTEAGLVFCWGSNEDNKLLAGAQNTTIFSPIEIPDLANASHVTVGRTAMCAETDEGLYCWGFNSKNAVGAGEVDTVVTPTSLGMFTDVRLNEATAFAKDQDGVWNSWGAAIPGATNIAEPTRLTERSQAHDFQPGLDHVCWVDGIGLRPTDCYGENQIALQHNLDQRITVSLTSFEGGSCAISRSDRDAQKRLSCWGDNTGERFGIEGDSIAGMDLGPADNIVDDSLNLGPKNLCYVTVDGEAVCAGSNLQREIDDVDVLILPFTTLAPPWE